MSFRTALKRKWFVAAAQVVVILSLAVVGYLVIEAEKESFFSPRGAWAAISALGVGLGAVLALTTNRWKSNGGTGRAQNR
jgi:hypothetical protein